jgi:hypothetical protein
MADQEMIAATLAAAILQARMTRVVGQAQHIAGNVPGGANVASMLAGNPNEIADTVKVYLDVLRELQSQSMVRTPSP